MMDRLAAGELEYHVRAALKIADDLKLWVAAAALDQALIALTGRGVMPPSDECQHEHVDTTQTNGVTPHQPGLA